MTSETMNRDRRSAMLAAVIGTVLASYAGSAAAIEFEFENGGKLNWNTTVSVGSSWRAEEPSEQLSALYYAECSAALTTEQFARGIRRVIAHHRFPTWPAAVEIIEAGNPQPSVEVRAATAWQELIKLAYGLATTTGR